MLKIYHAKGTRSVRPIWLCYELDLPVEVVPVDLSSPYRESPEWRAASPAGKIPAMRDGPTTMFESGAIVEYILERYGNGRLRPPPGTSQSALHHQWCWFAEATLLRPVGVHRILRAASNDGNTLVAEAAEKARACIDVVDKALADHPFLLGEEFGACDIMMGYSLAIVASAKLLDEGYPNATAYLARLTTREACIRAMNA